MFNKYKGILKIIPKNICITKKEFCDIINSMKEIDGRFEEITKVLGETSAINGPITINDKLYRNILTFLKRVCGDEKTDVIEWWLYDTSEKKVYINSDSPLNLTDEEVIIELNTVEDLYDYLMYLN